MNQISVFQPSIGQDELMAVWDVFQSNWIGKGKVTAQFEGRFAKHLGVNPSQVLSTSSCTAGLFNIMRLIRSFHPLLRPLNVVMPSISFVGAANAVVAADLRPRFCDVDPRTLNPTVEHIERMCDRDTIAVVVLHYGGLPCEIDKIAEFCKNKGLFLIEDSACSVASTHRGRACGTWGDFGVWSFDAMKILCTGDGGMMYVAHEELMKHAERMCFLGLSSESGMVSTDLRWWEFEVTYPGDRSIMNDVQSAIGVVQLQRLSGFIERRREIHKLYNKHLKKVVETPPDEKDYQTHSHYFYWIQTKDRDDLARFLRNKGIYTTFRYYPLSKVKYYEHDGSELPGAEYAAAHTLNLPIHQALKDSEVEYVAESIKEFYGA